MIELKDENEVFNHLDQEYKAILEYCKADRLLLAHQLMGSLDEYMKSFKNHVASNEEITKLIEQIQQCPRLKRLRVEHEEISELVQMMDKDHNKFGWKEISNSHGIHCLYKENGSGMHSIRMDGIIESPIFDVCAVIMEVALYGTWIPNLKEAKLLGEDNRFKKLIYARSVCPWPVSDRDVCLFGYGVDMLEEHDKIMVIARSVRDGDLDGISWKLPDPIKNVVRVDTKISGFTITPISETQTLVQVVSLTDPRMAMMPYWLLNFVTTQFCHYLFVMLRKQSKSVQSSKHYKTAIETNPVYSELKQMAQVYFQKKATK
ncbi:hypothetical protein DLAC_04147 [Tieghemostelium lacteum]|uniref:START domain-containing protein n=1 Tax=Tieghemostelium lacteum TaxID=361077 RepID=A0A151ZS43_TIELA|nr:hypothetical protein DLAC_04147 [Tieghemostelium lacteum]|eukprot:KYQ96841.1 hypothetical protein DLAC_04147 [Tieghemostelium lacteum]